MASASTLPLPRVSVIMPTFEQAAFIGRALGSLWAQSFGDWELIVVDDGSRDGSAAVLAPWLADPRVRYLRFDSNGGLGRAINAGLELARGELVAYLPSDDLWYAGHLAQLVAAIDGAPGAVLAYAGVRHHYKRSAPGIIPGECLQLVQCLHRASRLRWRERAELESDDLDRLFWDALRACGPFVPSGDLSCEWVDHPDQRHKRMREPSGGINPFRQIYRVSGPLRFHTSTGNAIDEERLYAQVRAAATDRPDAARRGLKIVLAGELAYNADRVLALEALGHRLYGLWTPSPYWYNTVGPLPFGHVEDLPRQGWREALARIEPDLIYAQLNWQAVPFAHEVMRAVPDIPFVWHFKEGPFICIEKGSWPLLADLVRLADGCIYSSPEMRDWFATAIPRMRAGRPDHVLDGDLPRRAWFLRERAPLLSAAGGELHTVVPGRPIGLHPPTVAELARHGIHLHFYGDFTQGQWREWIARAGALAPAHLHLHANVDHDRWAEEFSQYDAGWLHVFRSTNGGDVRRADWDDLNLPARMATLAAAGLPMIGFDNRGAVVAAQALAERLGVGLFFESIEGLARRLHARDEMAALRERVWQVRDQFCFDLHAPALVDFFERVIASCGKPMRPQAWRGPRQGRSPASC
ncbi:glycosyltransferase [Massilia sp. IC2-477]|uniref:glycosyltransferase n=1 Tax=Massilia sp. IC2-477 TaxID=2887198 RepID=UPI001D1115AE|nr:glycosyltransferase [Massilia sp. IC2-477]MCC2957647.1 glycosyltransferase [Massilia sp. IC2-477]